MNLSSLRKGSALFGATLLAACASAPSVVNLQARPAEGALLAGIQAYDDGRYADAESQLGRALSSGLRAPADKAAAHKLRAFIRCSQGRVAPCEADFRAAHAADARFTLSDTERGHPAWGPVWQRVAR